MIRRSAQAHRLPYGASDEPGWRDVELGGHARTLDLAAGTLNFVDAGSGPDAPLVLLHGIGGCWQHWIQNIPRLMQERRVIAVDLPGFGASPLPRGTLTTSLSASLVAELLERLGLPPVVLVGSSLGGMIAVELAATWPELVERLVLVAPAGVSVGSIRHGAQLTARLTALQSRQATKLLQRFGLTGGHPMSIAVRHPELLERGLLRAAFAPGAGTPGFGLTVLHLLKLRVQGRLMHQASSVACPTLIVWGADDQINLASDAEVFAGLIAGSETAILEDAGHVPMLEHPREFNRLLLEFAERP